MICSPYTGVRNAITDERTTLFFEDPVYSTFVGEQCAFQMAELWKYAPFLPHIVHKSRIPNHSIPPRHYELCLVRTRINLKFCTDFYLHIATSARKVISIRAFCAISMAIPSVLVCGVVEGWGVG